MTDLIDAELAAIRDPRVTITTRFNPFYKVADNLGSCWMARERMREDFVIVNGDTLFETAILKRLLASPAAPITVAKNETGRCVSQPFPIGPCHAFQVLDLH
jgi:choline kinase